MVAALGYSIARVTAQGPVPRRGAGDPKDMSQGSGSGGPTLRAVTWWARLFGGVLPTLALCGLLWRSLAPAYGARAAALAIGLYALATPAAAYAHLLYGHQLAACLLWAGLLLLVRAREQGRPGPAALGGALAGSAVLVEYTAAFAGLAAAGLVLGLLRARVGDRGGGDRRGGGAGGAAAGVPRGGVRRAAQDGLPPQRDGRVRREARPGPARPGRAELARDRVPRAVAGVGPVRLGAAVAAGDLGAVAAGARDMGQGTCPPGQGRAGRVRGGAAGVREPQLRGRLAGRSALPGGGAAGAGAGLGGRGRARLAGPPRNGRRRWAWAPRRRWRAGRW
ncbi:hypothetical protein OV079_19115 [Nannocystis pusilla]|uniref:Glycosyltransferase RgtA/B/C/D-like domain-containing protein n=1 Tax=Nannocystis pusilla TaxID=889268 RepID=A0A9X3EPU6_9BACT|nr:hypothetical protein [Nannocystis pusilla]MCY1007621.1 hypothetical protein [Nannocystis pusilla]